MSVTIRDVARESGYSVYTVSSTINNKGRVAEATRKKIQETIRRLGYNPARNIPHHTPVRTGSIGLVIPGDLQAIHPSNYRAVMATKKAATRLGYDFTLYTEQDIFDKAVTGFHNGRGQLGCDGLIIYTPLRDYEEYLANLARWEVPMVLVRRSTEVPGVMIVRDNDRQAVTLLMEHLCNLGHRSIAFYSYSGRNPHNPERFDAYDAFIRAHGLNADPDLRISRSSLDRGDRNETADPAGHPALAVHLRNLMTRPAPPTAALCYTDQLAVELIRTLHTIGLHVPNNFSVAGLNNDTTAVMYDPTITSANLPAEEMIDAACDLLVRTAPEPAGARTILEFGNELIVRQSTGPVHIKD